MTITELSIKRPILIIVFFAILTLLGAISYLQLKYELIPDVSPPYVSVVTIYPGASPNEVENSVTKPIEDAVSTVEKVKRVYATSAENVSFVMIEYQRTANADLALQGVQRRINQIVDQLPDQVQEPVISKLALDELPVLRIAATSSLPPREFYQLLKDQIKPRLSQIAGVGLITLVGGEEREIRVLLNADRLRAYKLSVLQVVEMLRRSDLDMPAGKIKDTDAQYAVRLTGKIQDTETLREVIVAVSSQGERIKLRDVAEVVDGHKESNTFSRLNNKSAVGMLVQKQADANVVVVSELARNNLLALEREYNGIKLRFDVAQDASEFTLEAAQAVNKDLTLAIILVALVMLGFLHSIRNSLIVMVAIPTSLISTFIAMYLFNFSLNLMTLLAMSLVIGILVDDSIVVLENIYRHLEMGKERRSAALVGRNEIGFAALSITLVDVVVFVPLILLTGEVGNILRQFSVVVVVSTLMSLLVSFTLTPMLASRFSRQEHLVKNTLMERFGYWFEHQFAKIIEVYTRLLKWSLNHRLTVAVGAFLLFIVSLSLVPLGFIGSEFVTLADKGEFIVTLTLPPGASLEQTNFVTQDVERMAAAIPEVRKIFTNVGVSSEGFSAYVGGQASSNSSEISVTLVSKHKRTRGVQEVGEELKTKILQIPGVKVRVNPIGILGTGMDAPIQVLLRGSNMDSLRAAANILTDVVQSIPATADVRLSTEEGKPETQIVVDREKMATYGLTLDQVGMALRVKLTGYDEMKFREGKTEYAMRLLLHEADRAKTSDLESFTFINPLGHPVELKQFARVDHATGPTLLDRRDRNSAITVYSQVVGRPSGSVGEDIQKALAETHLPSGVKVSFEGDIEMQEESFADLGLALIAALLLMYLIMVALYNSWVYPFIVLFSVPVAVVGALFALAFTMKSLNIFSILGVIIMMGLVAKNAILLVDRTNQARAEGKNVSEALLMAARQRLRPILMTTFSLVLAMMPIALATGPGSELKAGLGIALIGGLTSSLFLTLVLVPTVYIDMERLRDKLIHAIRRWFPSSSAQETGTEKVPRTAPAVLSLVLLLVGTTVVSAQPRRLSLNEALVLAERHNTDLQLAALEKEKTSERVREAWGNAFPTITAEARYARYMKLPVFFFPTFSIDPSTGSFSLSEPSRAIEVGAKNEFNGAISFQMPIYNKAVYAGIQSAGIAHQMAFEDCAAARGTIIAEVKKAYYNILIAKERKRLLGQSIGRAQEMLDAARQLFRQGLATDADTLRAFVVVENQRPMLIKAENAIEISHAMLKLLLGLPYHEQVQATDRLLFGDFEYPAMTFEAAYQEALSRKPELRKLALQVDAADAMIDLERAGHFPALSAFGQYQIQDQANDFNFSNYGWPSSRFVGLQLSVPLFAGYRTDARVQQAEIARQQADAQLRKVKESIALEITVSLANLAEANRRIEAQQKTVQAAQRSYQQIRSRWFQGLSKQIELTDAELALSQAKTEHLQAVYDALVAKADLERALGQNAQ